MRVILSAVALFVACALVVAGVAAWSAPSATIVAGVLLAVWSYLVLAEPAPAVAGEGVVVPAGDG